MIGADFTKVQPKRTDIEIPCLSMRRREAAKAIGISVGELDTWTKEGIIPCVRIGRVILYPVNKIREWLDKKAQEQEQKGYIANDKIYEK